MWSKTFFTGMVLLIVLLGLTACASPGQPPADPGTPVATAAAPQTSAPASNASAINAAAASPADVEEYRIGPEDLLELQVFGADALNRTVRVNSRGLISLPLVGLIQAAGLTSQQLEQSLAAKLSENYLQNPQVSVFIKEFTSQRVTVEGEVKKPGVYPLKGRTTLLQTLATAEGLTTVADPNSVKVFRADLTSGARTTLEFDLEKIRTGEIRDPDVRNDDIVQVGKSLGKSVAKELIEFIVPFRVLSPRSLGY